MPRVLLQHLVRHKTLAVALGRSRKGRLQHRVHAPMISAVNEALGYPPMQRRLRSSTLVLASH